MTEELLNEYAAEKSWDWTLSTPPTHENVDTYMGKLKDCAAGLEGVINAAWREGGTPTRDYCGNLVGTALRGQKLPEKVNDGLFVFTPKGDPAPEENMGTGLLFRKPKDMRPLTLKAGDNKILAGVTNSAILPTVAASASRVQRGFVPLRQLTQNIVDLDFRARQAALQYQNNNILHRFSVALTLEMLGVVTGLPMMVLFDYAAAFPSVAHAWIDAVLRTIKVPRGVLNVFRALYKSNQAYAAIGSDIVWLFEVGCGVLQGCPFSGTLFVIAIDPLLHMFEKFIISPGFGHVYACADDIGVVLHECRMLIRLYNLFYIMELASGLKLKPSKCVLVPVAVEASVHNVHLI